MTGRRDAEEGGHDVLPRWPAENYVCEDCRLSYRDISVERAIEAIRSLPAMVRDAVDAVPAGARRQRPRAGSWSVTEYVCHLRDVFAIYTIRLHRVRTEDRPALEPMLNDLRARRFRYIDYDVNAVLDELAMTAAGFRAEAGRFQPDQWDLAGTRLPGEERTARWLLRQAMHEGQHHLDDIRRTSQASGRARER